MTDAAKPKVLCFAPFEDTEYTHDWLRDARTDLVFGDPDWMVPGGEHEDDLIGEARDSAALIGTSLRATPITRRVMESAQRLRIVAKYTVGVDDVDTIAATDLGILVTHGPTEVNCFAVAETTMTMMLAMLKKVREREADVYAGKWRGPEHLTTYVGSRLSDGYKGITIGLVGLGRIGCRVADLLAPWRVRIIAYDPHAEPSRFLLHNVTRVDYDTLLREADVVSLHVVHNRETHQMFGEREMGLMKKDALVINTSRGKVVDEDALARVLKTGHLMGAALDVFEAEPLPMDSPLRELGTRVLLAPHAASYNHGGSLIPGVEWATRSVIAALRGEVPDNVYNKEVIPRWLERFGDVSLLD